MEKKEDDSGGSKDEKSLEEAPHISVEEPEIIVIHVPKESFDAYSIVIILMGFLICFFTEGALTNFGKLLTEISLEFHKSRPQISMIGSTFTGVHFTVGPFASALINAIGFRKSGVIGAIVASFGLFLASNSTEFVQLLISHAIAGFGTGTMSAVGNICIGYYFDKYRPMAVGIATAGTGFGTFFIAPLVHLIVDESKPRHWNKFMLCESLVLLCFIFICLLASKPKKMTLKAVKAEEPEPNWLQKVLNPATVVPKPEEATQDESEYEADMEFSRKASYPVSELEKIVSFGPTLAEMYEIHSPPPEPENIVKKPSKQKISILKWRHTYKHKNIMKPQLLDTEDILYDQSSRALANRRSTNLQLPAAISNLEKRLLMIHAPKKVNDGSRCKRIRAQTVQTFLKIFDLSLFKTWTFCVAYVAVLCYALALFIPYSFITDRAIDSGMNKDEAMLLTSIIGVGNIVLRITIGIILTYFPVLQASRFTGFALIFAGTAAIVTAFFPHHPFLYQAIYCVCFAFGNASFMALRSVIYVEIMGIENLTRTFGMITMMLGIGIFIGTPALGSFKNIFGTYTYTFVAAGALFIASGFLHGSLPSVKKWEESKVKIVKM